MCAGVASVEGIVQILSRKVDIHTAYNPKQMEGSLPKTYGWAPNPFSGRMTI
jgi:hypothetical protein